MPIKDKNMSIIRLRPNSQYSLHVLFEDIFYRDKSGALAGSALGLYERARKDGLKASEWQKHISGMFKVQPVDPAETAVLEEICRKHGITAEGSRGLRGVKPYQLLIEKNAEGKVRLDEKELALLKRVSKWHSSVSSYYSIINKLKAIGLIEKREGTYKASNSFLASLRAIEKSLQE